MKLATRIAKLEMASALTRDNRMILRFEGPGSDQLPQPTRQELASVAEICTIRFVAAKDGRPAETA